MRTSTTTNTPETTTAANLAQLSLCSVCVFNSADQVALNFYTSDAPSTFTGATTSQSVHTFRHPHEFKGWCMTLRSTSSEANAFGAVGMPKTPVPVVKFAADLTAQMVKSTEAACSTLPGVITNKDRLQLLQLQKSYQAAAQFLQVAQTKLDTLVKTMQFDNEDPS